MTGAGTRADWDGPASPELRDRWRRDRRAVVRRHHPDLGGDPAALQDGLRANDELYRGLERDAAWRTAHRRPRPVLRSVVRGMRSRLPHGWPGRRRYFDL